MAERKANKAAPKTKTGRSNQGRGNKDKTTKNVGSGPAKGKTAGKGFVAPRASRSDKKAIGKGLAKMAAVAAPGAAVAKGVAGAAKLTTMASKARTSGRAAVQTSQSAGPSRQKIVKQSLLERKNSLKQSLETAEKNAQKALKAANNKQSKFWQDRIKKVKDELDTYRYIN